MEIESLEIFQYLKTCEPISGLTEFEQKRLMHGLEIVYAKRGDPILKPGEINAWLYLIRSGAVERYEANGDIVAKFAEKDFFGQASVRRDGKILRQVKATEDTLLYRFPATLFLEFFNQHEYFRFYFERNSQDQQLIKYKNSPLSSSLSITKVKSIIHESPKMVDHKTSVSECAKLMQKNGSTYLLITQNDNVVGIVTDRVFCTKVVAEQLSGETPVGLIMSDQLQMIDEDAVASEALMKMARYNFRHLPVQTNGKVVGVLTATDLIHRQSNNPIYLVNQISKASSIEVLKRYADNIPASLSQMVENGLSSHDISYTISSVGRAINLQLIKLAEQRLGPAPIEYCWVIAGSLARNDQTAKSDQDNLLILSDDYQPQQHGVYFEQLAKWVCDGLNECGYIYCPGNVMASNPQWRQPLSQWENYFKQWITEPDPKALMYASIFFDLRSLSQSSGLLKQLNQYVIDLIQEHQLFLNFMAANALSHTPPLGFFRHFVLEKHGSEQKSMDLKKRGVVPIVDLARVYALSCNAYPINTVARLEASFHAGGLSLPGYQDLRDAFEFLSELRLQHQARLIRQGEKAHNFLPPQVLSSLERRHLKDTFEIIRTYQSALASRYQTGRIG